MGAFGQDAEILELPLTQIHSTGELPGFSKRFVFIDGLRGIAALGVVLFHFHHAIEGRPGYALFPAPLHWFLRQSWLGVEIFFVISGFVIAHSLRKASVTWNFIGNFALRRSLRLDPPYWAIIGVVTANLWISSRLHPGRANPASVPVVAANLFYLQYLLHLPSLLDIFWTLCLEIQFYLLLIFLIRWTQPKGDRSIPRLAVYVTFFSALASIASNLSGHSFSGWFINYWYMFAAGSLAYWTWNGLLSRRMFLVFLAAVFVFSLLHREPAAFVVATFSMLIYLAGILDRLTTWLSGAVWQWLGRISYSLYLSHGVFAGAIFDYGHHLTGRSRLGSLGLFFFVLVLSLGLAWMMYLIVERPSHRLSAKCVQKWPSPMPAASQGTCL